VNTELSPQRLELAPLLRGDVAALTFWIRNWRGISTSFAFFYILLGAGSFGLALGSWRAPLQGLYCGIKLPLILVLTAGANGAINGMLAPLLGIDFSFRQSFAAVLSSFAIASIILGGFSPLIAFTVWNCPPLETMGNTAANVHNPFLVTLVIVVGFAGFSANVRLFQLLRTVGGGEPQGLRLLLAWLAINLLLGSQIAWILRPFIGAPGLPVVFLREDAFQGSFFETFLSAAGLRG
jgi:hypothetical protein